MNHCRQVVLHKPRFFSRHETRQYKNRIADAVLANRYSLVRACNAKPVRPGFLQRLSHFRAAVPVPIALDDGENLARRLALLVRWIDVPADRLEILCQRAKRDFRPYRASHFFAASFPCACHVPSEKFSLRHPRGLRPPPATLAAA